MTDRKSLNDPNEPPEDVAMLYSWANLHGAKYRDFSASRALVRERSRQRAQQAIEEEQARLAAEAQRTEEARRMAEVALAEERVRRAEIVAQQAARQAAQEAAQRAAQQAAQEMARRAAEQAAQEARAAQLQAAQHAEAARAAQRAAQQAAWQQPESERFLPPAPVPPSTPYTPPQAPRYAAPQPASQQPLAPSETAQQPARPNYPASSAFRQASTPPVQPAPSTPTPSQPTPMREDGSSQPLRTPWSAPEARDLPMRPAWLAERPQAAPAATAAQTPEDTIQGSRDRLTSRWFALKSVLDGAAPAADTAPAASTSRAPVLAVFSLAGGVGKTSLVATLGRALSSRGERVLLVDTAAFGLLPFFFGARDQRPGQLRTFSPPAASGDAPIQMVALDPESLAQESGGQEPLSAEIQKHNRGVSRVIVDLATASGSTTRRILRLSPLVLVPVVPDMNSVVSVGSIDAFFEHNSSTVGKTSLPFYVLNQFDPSLPLHLDVREVLREQLGDRLLPFALRRAPAVSEALAEGMTVMDYAPNSTVAEDFGSLAGWVKSQSAPASGGFRGVRWSER